MHTDQPKDVQQADSDGAAAAPAAGNEAKFDKGAYFIGAHVHNDKIQGLLVPPVQLRPGLPRRSQLALGTLGCPQSGHQVLFVQRSRTQEAGRMWSPSFCLAPLCACAGKAVWGKGYRTLQDHMKAAQDAGSSFHLDCFGSGEDQEEVWPSLFTFNKKDVEQQ